MILRSPSARFLGTFIVFTLNRFHFAHIFSSIATEVKYWELQELDALPTWTRGRAIVIGDAAHAMPPLQGQGANQAGEDGESFRLLEGVVEPRDVPKVLKRIHSLRRPRATQVQEDTRNMAGEVSWEDRMAKYDFLYSYNGIREA